MGKYDEFDLNVKEIKTNANANASGAWTTTFDCIIDTLTIITDAVSCNSCGICSVGGRSQCGPCTVSSQVMPEARC